MHENSYFMHGDHFILMKIQKQKTPHVTCIRQVATLLDCDKPHILQVFKNTLLTRLYSVLFPLEDIRLAVETAKRILMKEKIDRQLAGQSPQYHL